jgi:hypothetical protein
MNLALARTTNKHETLGVLAANHPFPNGVLQLAYDTLIMARTPLPPVYIRQFQNGGSELVGAYSQNLIATVHYLFNNETDVRIRRLITGTNVPVVVFEYCQEQQDLINAYYNANILTLK